MLLAAEGLAGAQIAERAGCTEPAVIRWRRRYAGRGLAGLQDAPRPGGPTTVLTGKVVCEILAAAVTPPPESLRAAGLTHWSGRRLAGWLARARGIRVSHDPVTVVWHEFCLQPHRGFKFSAGPHLDAEVHQAARSQCRDRLLVRFFAEEHTHSMLPNAASGGDLGWRWESMPDNLPSGRGTVWNLAD
jgi:transposase